MGRWDGIYRKFRVERTDGGHKPGRKHSGCSYFVLDLDHDPCARAALRAYAEACAEQDPRLAAELRDVANADKMGARFLGYLGVAEIKRAVARRRRDGQGVRRA